ncbi:unnamed protein product [Lactuca saligna]|uniref:Uncharacterized protein n=1 Tax=Lactuca saligna TaxID=75948 RepID=A0AA35YRZ5_LACSI|nr:unnamed protein product [Lactuca saligna]
MMFFLVFPYSSVFIGISAFTLIDTLLLLLRRRWRQWTEGPIITCYGKEREEVLFIFSSGPSIRFSSDETVASRMATNEIQFFDFSKGMVHKIRIPGIAAVELSKQPGSHVAVFVPESKVIYLDICMYTGFPKVNPLVQELSSDVQQLNIGTMVLQGFWLWFNQMLIKLTREKKDVYMMFNGRIQGKNLQLFMDIRNSQYHGLNNASESFEHAIQRVIDDNLELGCASTEKLLGNSIIFLSLVETLKMSDARVLLSALHNVIQILSNCYNPPESLVDRFNWPSIRFSSDETVSSRMATNEIQFFDFSKGMVHKIRIPGIAAVELSKQPGSHAAVFVPESKEKKDVYMMFNGRIQGKNLQLFMDTPSLFSLESKQKDGSSSSSSSSSTGFTSFSSFKNIYITGHSNGGINFWDASSPLLIPIVSFNQQSEDDQTLSGVPLTALCYDMETRLLISGDQTGTVSVIDIGGATVLYERRIASEISTAVISLQFGMCSLHGFEKSVLMAATRDSSAWALKRNSFDDGVVKESLLLCSEKAVYVYSLSHVVQASTCCSDAGLVLVFTNGKIEIRSLPELILLKATSIRGLALSTSKPNSLPDSFICASHNAPKMSVLLEVMKYINQFSYPIRCSMHHEFGAAIFWSQIVRFRGEFAIHFLIPTGKLFRPSIRFSSDKTVASRMATNEIQFFDFSKGMVHKIRIPGIAAVELSKQPGSHVAVFVPESKASQSEPISTRTFFRCSTAQHWNHGSTRLLVVVQSDVDKTNQRKEGLVHDVQWSYSGKEFAIVYG